MPPEAEFRIRCDCGRDLLARREHVGRPVRCPFCKRTMALEKVRDPQTLQTRIRRAPAQVPIPPGKPTSPSAGPGQDLLCACGASLRVTSGHLGRQAQCPQCGALMRLEKGRDPQTHRTELRVKVVGAAPPPASADPESLDLNDFR